MSDGRSERRHEALTQLSSNPDRPAAPPIGNLSVVAARHRRTGVGADLSETHDVPPFSPSALSARTEAAILNAVLASGTPQ